MGIVRPDRSNPGAFCGAKLLLFIGGRLVVLLRDDRSDIPWPGRWDLPGGARDGGESPSACVLRETAEETGIVLRDTALDWARAYAVDQGVNWMFAAHLPEARATDLRLGNEGQELARMSPREFASNPRAIPHFVERMQHYLEERNPDLQNPPR
jgi:8-oxo-dGTP diphosphatase